jgi:hypothetical protein
MQDFHPPPGRVDPLRQGSSREKRAANDSFETACGGCDHTPFPSDMNAPQTPDIVAGSIATFAGLPAELETKA